MSVDRDHDGRVDKGDGVRVVAVVTNSGNVVLHSVAVTDSLVKRLGSSVTCSSRTLAPGASTRCSSGTVYVTHTQAAAGVIHNSARATAQTSSGALVRSAVSTASLAVQAPPASRKRSAHHHHRHVHHHRHAHHSHVKRQKPLTAKLSLTQYIAGVRDLNHNGQLDQGDSVRFGFQVSNVGGLSVDGLHIVDHRLARLKVSVSCAATWLSPGQTTICTSGRMVITRYMATKHLGRNFAYAAATSSEGTAVRSGSTVITLVRSIAKLPDTGSGVGLGVVGAAVLALLAGLTATAHRGGRRRRSKPVRSAGQTRRRTFSGFVKHRAASS